MKMLPLTIDTLPVTSKGLVKFAMTNHGWKRIKERYGVKRMNALKEMLNTSVRPKNIASIQNGHREGTFKIICRNGITIVVRFEQKENKLVICTLYDTNPKTKGRKKKGSW